MAREPRVEFEGAFYHVIARGNQRQDIFRDDKDRAIYLERLEHYRKRYDFKLYAYVLMSNHVHLLIETQKIPLSKIMQGIQFTYTQYYNRRHRTVGHLFQGRYKAILCDREAEGSLEVPVEQSPGLPRGENGCTDRHKKGIGAVWQNVSTGAASLQEVYGRRDRARSYRSVL